MGEAINLSDEFVAEANAAAKTTGRSLAGQIEYWARLGRAFEPLLYGSRAPAPQRSDTAVRLWHLLATVDSPEGRQRLAEYLKSTPFPHFEAAPGRPGLLVRIDADGTRTVGRFVDREFVPVK